ncbi:YidB family protein [Actinocorallia sp. A-T 12471]|uniref:YidB family protein n=1 Tax=Actinocorallia sp. A-T 12471 TaxID=3089813 RepID=UPI0029D357BA|nr:YidB family protein [Actinocorallia sp. A-T 12471]MDX6739608.1 YidB family protein [Actinocorallia sp. A-T 12471]
MDLSQLMKLAQDPQVQQMVKSLVSGLGDSGQAGGQAAQGKGGGGGLQDLLGQLAGGGLSKQVDSWVGTGTNEPVTGQEVKQALGPDTVQQMAQAAGVAPDKAADDLANALPGLVDKATPAGSVDPKPGQ